MEEKIYITQLELEKKLKEIGLPSTYHTTVRWMKEGMPYYNIAGGGHKKFVWSEVLDWLVRKPEDK